MTMATGLAITTVRFSRMQYACGPAATVSSLAPRRAMIAAWSAAPRWRALSSWRVRLASSFGRKPSDYDPEAFQGIHAAAVLVLIDEACGVPKSLWDAASTLLTNGASRTLAIGNPDDPGSYFAQVCKPGSGWNVLRIAASDTPNFTVEEIPPEVRPLLISPLWVDERRAEWGEGSPLYVSKVDGEFPESADDGVIPYGFVRAAQLEPLPLPDTPVELGVDVGAGGDETVIWERRGGHPGRRWRDQSDDPMAVVDKIVRAIAETGATSVKIDEIGIGWAVRGRLVELGEQGTHKARIVGVNVGEASGDPTRFPRLRDQLWWETRTRAHPYKGHRSVRRRRCGHRAARGAAVCHRLLGSGQGRAKGRHAASARTLTRRC